MTIRSLIWLLGISACSRSPQLLDTSSTGTDTRPQDDTGTDTIPPSEGCADEAVPLAAEICIDTAPCSWSGQQTYEYFGYMVDAGGDINGDGREDILIGGPTWDGTEKSGATRADTGRVIWISGAALDHDGSGKLGMLEGSNHGDYVGESVAIVGDVNGDGHSDSLIGARGFDDGETEDAGAALLVFGGEWTDENREADVLFYGERELSRAGSMVDGGGDLNGDGLAELLIVGEFRQLSGDYETDAAGRVYVIGGSEDEWTSQINLADADASFDGEADRNAAGRGLDGTGDLNSDGYADLIVGAPYAGSYLGRTYVIPGGNDLLDGNTHSLSDATIIVEGESSYDAFGWSVTTGDLNGDGFDDLIVGSPLHNATWGDEGSVYIYPGSADFFAATPEPMAKIDGEHDDFQLGTGLDASGDVNGDQINDLLVGAVSALEGLVTKSGRTYLFYGRSSEFETLTNARQADVQVFGSSVKDYIGRSHAAADINADGKSDILIGGGYANVQGYTDVGSTFLFFGN